MLRNFIKVIAKDLDQNNFMQYLITIQTISNFKII